MIFLEEILEEGHLLQPSIQGEGEGGNVIVTPDTPPYTEDFSKKSYFFTPYKVDFDSE